MEFEASKFLVEVIIAVAILAILLSVLGKFVF